MDYPIKILQEQKDLLGEEITFAKGEELEIAKKRHLECANAINQLVALYNINNNEIVGCGHSFIMTDQSWKKCQHCGEIRPVGQSDY